MQRHDGVEATLYLRHVPAVFVFGKKEGLPFHVNRLPSIRFTLNMKHYFLSENNNKD